GSISSRTMRDTCSWIGFSRSDMPRFISGIFQPFLEPGPPCGVSDCLLTFNSGPGSVLYRTPVRLAERLETYYEVRCQSRRSNRREDPMSYVEELFSIKGKTALVTGGATGIGRMIAIAIVKAGANALIASRKGADCERVSAELNQLGGGR